MEPSSAIPSDPTPANNSDQSRFANFVLWLGVLFSAGLTIAVLPYFWGITLVNTLLFKQIHWLSFAKAMAVVAVIVAVNSCCVSVIRSAMVKRWLRLLLLAGWASAFVCLLVFYVEAKPTELVPVLAIVLLSNLWAVLIGWQRLFTLPKSRWLYPILVSMIGLPALLESPGMMGASVVIMRLRPILGAKSDKVASLPNEPELPAPDHVKLTLASKPSETDFPGYLGADRTGVLKSPTLARDWKTKPPKERWRREVGKGWGAAVIASGSIVGPKPVNETEPFIFSHEQRGGYEALACYRLRDGSECWVASERAKFPGGMGDLGPRATPTVAGEHIFSVGATGWLHCRLVSTGKVVWKVNILDHFKSDNLPHGVSGSPLVLDTMVIVNPTGSHGPTIAAFDRATGKPIWHTGTHQTSYSSPMLARVSHREQAAVGNTDDWSDQILSFDGPGLTGYDPKTGKQLWQFPLTNIYTTNVAQPIVNAGASNRILISTGYGTGAALFTLSKNEKGDWQTTKVWTNHKMEAKFTTLVRYRDHVFGLDDGIMACLRINDGKQVWKSGRYGHGQILLVNDLIIVLGEDGKLRLVEANHQKHVELGKIDALADKTWNTFAISGEHLVVRNNQEMACYQLVIEK